MFKYFIVLMTLSSTLQLSAQWAPQTSIQEAMIQDLEAVKYSMSIKYAPKEWKKNHLGWDLNTACEEAKAKIFEEDLCTSKDYQKIFKSFLKSTQDYHVNTHFFSTEWSYCPLSVKNIDGHYYISSVEGNLTLSFVDFLFIDDMDEIETPEKFNETFSKLNVGDELLTINDQPVKEIIETIINDQLGGDRSDTANGLAERSLFFRRGKYGYDVPTGTFSITVRHQNSEQTNTYVLPWFHVPEWVMNKSLAKEESTVSKPLPSALIEKHLNRDFTAHYAEELLSRKQNVFLKNPDCEEKTDWREKGFLPPLGKVIWETDEDDDLYAYLYKTKSGKNIGYIYLSTFHYGEDAENALDEIINAIKIFNRKSDALVLDITDNPGGNLLYTYGVLSVLTEKPLAVPTDREILIQEDVYRAAILSKLMKEFQEDEDLEGMTLWGYPFDQKVCQCIIDYCHKIISSWEAGKTLTDPLFVYGIEEIMPHPEVRYNKPILLLTNELDFSCADFFPAILQDNNRAILFGNRTAGAGGYVLSYPHASRFGVMGYTLTGSIAFRKDGKPIENLGVTPEIPYKCTKRDITENYVDYINAVNSEIERLSK